MCSWACGYVVLSKLKQGTFWTCKEKQNMSTGLTYQSPWELPATQDTFLCSFYCCKTAVAPLTFRELHCCKKYVRRIKSTVQICPSQSASISKTAYNFVCLNFWVSWCLNKTLKIKSQNYRLLCTTGASVSLDQILMVLNLLVVEAWNKFLEKYRATKNVH